MEERIGYRAGQQNNEDIDKAWEQLQDALEAEARRQWEARGAPVGDAASDWARAVRFGSRSPGDVRLFRLAPARPVRRRLLGTARRGLECRRGGRRYSNATRRRRRRHFRKPTPVLRPANRQRVCRALRPAVGAPPPLRHRRQPWSIRQRESARRARSSACGAPDGRRPASERAKMPSGSAWASCWTPFASCSIRPRHDVRTPARRASTRGGGAHPR